MEAHHDRAYWIRLEEQADRPEIQAIIRESIRQGMIRVVPGPGGQIRIVPLTESTEHHPHPRASDRPNHGHGKATDPHETGSPPVEKH